MSQEKSLTQKEIDALLSILPADGAPLPGGDHIIGSVRAYDFRSPDKFSKEQIRTLQMIHENFGRRVSSSLSAYLRATVQVMCVHIEQGSFVDFMQNIVSPSLISIFRMEPLPGRMMLAVDASTVTIIIDRLLGGFGRPADESHDITDLEQSLMAGVNDYISQDLQEAWKNVIQLNIGVSETTLNPEFAQVALPSDAAVFLGFEIKARENMGMMSICLPYSMLKPVASELSPHTWVAGETKDTGIHSDALRQHVQEMEVDVSVLLGEITASFEDLLHLHENDVLMLNTMVGRPLSVLVGDCPKFQAQPGQSGRHLAVQIMTLMETKNDGSSRYNP
jgi:flagellar motor switch protein FliM